MEDQHDTADDGSIVSSRRTVLAATFGIPVLGGVGVGAADTVRRLTDADLAAAESIGPSANAADVSVDFASGKHPIDDDRYTQITLDPELLDDLGLSVGDQVRLHREDDRALYTVAAAMTESDASTIRMNRRARARLDVANTAWGQVGDYGQGCPELLGTSDLVDEEFDAVADPAVVSDSSIEAAQENGDLVEDADGDGTDLAILAPHGGDVEPYTAEQASDLHAAVDANASVWRALGYRPDGGAFLRWHVPSAAISPASFPALDDLLADDYDYAVSFHGICTNQIRVGGGASESVKRSVVDAINYHLPTAAAEAEVANGRFSARDPDALANRASEEGVWIGQPAETRTNHADVIVDAVAAAVDDWL